MFCVEVGRIIHTKNTQEIPPPPVTPIQYTNKNINSSSTTAVAGGGGGGEVRAWRPEHIQSTRFSRQIIMRSLKFTSLCAAAAAAVALLVAVPLFLMASPHGKAAARRVLLLTEEDNLPGQAFEEPDGERQVKCQAPEVYTPVHRRRVEAPLAGSVAANVRAVYEETSKKILVRVRQDQ